MSEPAQARPDHEELDQPAPSIKVNDKRRFKEDGVPVQTSHPPQQQQTSPEPVEPKAPQRAENSAETERLSLELDAARKRIDELARGLVHSEQDREAFKQRMTRERDQLLDLEKGKVALVLLEAIDDLELCLRGAPDSSLSKGVKLIRDGLFKKAEAFGLERVELENTRYDPNLAEASDMEMTPLEAEDGLVLAVSKAAWKLKGRVLRAGLVKVAKYLKPAQA